MFAYAHVRCMTFSMKHKKKKKHGVDVQDIGVIFDAISDSLLIFFSIGGEAESVCAPNSAHQRKPLVK